MPNYFYTAKTQKGETKSGVKEASDLYDLARVLREEELFLVSGISEEEKKKKPEFSLDILGVSLPEKIIFTRNLQVMISAGVALPQALKILSGQSKSKQLEKAILDIQNGVIKGVNFSDTLSKHPKIFSQLFISMVKAGEESGQLEEALESLVSQMEKEYELITRIQSALIYPAVIITTMVGTGILMLLVVVPELAKTFEELDLELPLTTKLVIGSASFLTEKWYIAIALLFSLASSLLISYKSKEGKGYFDRIILRLPILSDLIKKANSARVIRILSALMGAGVSLMRSLEISAEMSSNIYFKNAILRAADGVRKGMRLSDALSPYSDLYPPTVIQMLRVGEETGKTSEILEKLASFYEEEVARTTKNLVSALEPILMVIIGAAVGFFAISMIQPLYSMLGSI